MKMFPWILRIEVLLLTLIVGISIVAVIRFGLSVIDSAQGVPAEVAAIDDPDPVQPSDVPEEQPPPKEVPIYGDTTPMSNDDFDSFDPTGDYSIQWNAPETFADFKYFELETREYHDGNGNYLERLIPPRGVVHTNREFRIGQIAVAGHLIAFQTATVKGVSYRFTGRFEEGDYCELTGTTSALKGNLLKIKDGKVVAEMHAQFYRDCSCD